MTVGEKIQKYRKDLGMSQEDLGQKLLVSRQTISLWEKDQTAPTIDNLIRLKELFNVSIDEILCLEYTEKKAYLPPSEAYQFEYSKNELKKIFRFQRKKLNPRMIVWLALWFILFLVSTSSDIIAGAFLGVFIISLILFFALFRTNRKTDKKNTDRMCENTYEYLFFDEYLIANIYRNNEKMREFKCYYTDIEKIEVHNNWIFLQFGGQLFIMKKNELKENSILYSFMYKNPSKTVENKFPSVWKTISIIAFIASIASLFLGVLFATALDSFKYLSLSNMWMFFLATPIPIASVVLGCILKHKGYPYKKNIIVGMIMTGILCIYGCFSFILPPETSDHSDKPIIKAEQMLEIDIPNHDTIDTIKYPDGSKSGRCCTYLDSDIHFDKSVTQEFEKVLKTDDKWLSSIPNDLIGITSSYYDFSFYDYAIIYNVDTAEYNKLPSESGTYSFISVLYQLEENKMKIVEYDIEYVK